MMNPTYHEWELVKDGKLNVPAVLVYSDWLEEHEFAEEANAWRWVVKNHKFPHASDYYPNEWVWFDHGTTKETHSSVGSLFHPRLKSHTHIWTISMDDPNLKYYNSPIDALLDLVQAKMMVTND